MTGESFFALNSQSTFRCVLFRSRNGCVNPHTFTPYIDFAKIQRNFARSERIAEIQRKFAGGSAKIRWVASENSLGVERKFAGCRAKLTNGVATFAELERNIAKTTLYLVSKLLQLPSNHH